MTVKTGPGLRRRQLAHELAAMRTDAGMTADEVAAVLRCARSRVGHLEAGRNLPRATDVMVLAELYGVPDRLPTLMELWDEANVKGWWDTYRLPSWLKAFISLENDAVAVRCFSLEVVPALLQTRDYAEDSLRRHGSTLRDVEREVQVRTKRQQVFNSTRRLHAVMSEALLARTVHMDSIGVKQLDHLADQVNTSVMVQVLPFAVGAHRSMSGSFTLLELQDGSHVACQSYSVGSHLVDSPTVVTRLNELHDELSAASLSREASAELIKQYVLRGC